VPPASTPATPILKWAGGKGKLLEQFAPHFLAAGNYKAYFEPFLGGGAVFFHLQHAPSHLYDLNPHLIEVYTVVRDDVESLISALTPHLNQRDHFYAVRAQDPNTLMPVQRAARFIFLNKTCYNGLYRVNKGGQFNVPFGRNKNPTICNAQALRAASQALKQATLTIADFTRVLADAQAGDLVYLDPPYAPLSHSAKFTSYTSNGFSTADQQRLAEVYQALHQRGCLLMQSNSNAPLIHELYKDFHIHNISARRAINSKANGRAPITEVLITNFDAAKT
jgi:DNA adenine methylase